MGWTAPFTAVTGVLVTAAQLNGSYRDNLNFLNSTPGCRLRRAANQSINNITPTSISWDQEDLDTDGFITSPSTTITIPAGLDGRFAITVYAQAAANLQNRCYIDIIPTTVITGVPTNLRTVITAGNSDARYLATVVIPLLAGDSFVVQLFHTIGAATNHTAWMTCSRVSAS